MLCLSYNEIKHGFQIFNRWFISYEVTSPRPVCYFSYILVADKNVQGGLRHCACDASCVALLTSISYGKHLLGEPYTCLPT